MPGMWERMSNAILGYVAPQTKVNEIYVMSRTIDNYFGKGYTAKDIALLHNQGHLGACSKGVNKFGVAYNSCDYYQTVLAYYNK